MLPPRLANLLLLRFFAAEARAKSRISPRNERGPKEGKERGEDGSRYEEEEEGPRVYTRLWRPNRSREEENDGTEALLLSLPRRQQNNNNNTCRRCCFFSVL